MGVIRGSSYYKIVDGVNWSSAEANAVALGGNLFSISNESESKWLGNEFSKSKYQYSEDNSNWAPNEWSINHYWSGGIKENGRWKWSNGDSFKSSLSALYLNNSSDIRSDRLLGIFNNPRHTTNIYLDDYRDEYPNNPSNPYKGIAEVPLSYFSINDAIVEEGEKAKIKITRTGGISTVQTLILATSDGSAVAGVDYKKKSKTITFATGETSKSVNIVTNEDVNVESDETIKLTLAASSGNAVPAQIQNGSATVTIKDDDLKSIFSIDGTNVWEGDTSQVLITRKGNTSAAINLTLNTINGTASSGSDYTQLKDKTIRFGAGVRSKKISIATREDSAVESNETFKVKISSTNDLAQFNKTSATVTIEDNDQAIINKTTNIKNITNNYNGDIYHGDVNNNNVNIGKKNTLGDINVSAGSGSINTNEWAGKVFFELPSTATISDISKQWFGSTNTARTKAHTVDITDDPQLVHVTTETWSKKVKINKIIQASNNGDTIRAEAPEKFVPAIGSVLNGGQSRDIIEGMIGWDIIDGDDGSDFIHGGNGRDVITGGSGGDELWGDFGLNTFKSEKDGQRDLVVIKSDHYVYNWLNNSYTNNPNGERTDFIEGLDSWDRIRVTGGYKHDLRFVENVTHMGQTGIAIYLKDSLEALYTGNDLSVDQIMNMTDGDGSATAIANRVHQYGLDWF